VTLVVEPPPQSELVRSQLACATSLTAYVPAVTVKKSVVPVPPAVVTLGVEALGPLTVKPKVPLPPVVRLTILIFPWAVLSNVHVTVVPAATLNSLVDPPPQLEFVSAQPAAAVSLTVYVPAGTVIVLLPLPPEVVTLGDAALVPLTVKPKVPSPPVVCLTIAIWPCAALVNVHVTVVPAGTVKSAVAPPPQLDPVRAHPAAAVWVTVYVPAGTVIVVVPVPPDVVTLGAAALAPLTVKPNVPLPPVVFRTIAIWPCPAEATL
jgi:hypothetical protein